MGGSSGGSSAPTEQTVTQTQFPPEAAPYYTRLLSRGEAESLQPYAPYPSQRLAEFAPQEQQAFDMTHFLANQGTPWAMQQAQQTAGQLAQGVPSWAQQQAQQTASELAQGTPSWAQQQAQGTASRISNALPWEYQQAQQTASDVARGRPFEPWTGFQRSRPPVMPYGTGMPPWMQDQTFRGATYGIPGNWATLNQPPYLPSPSRMASTPAAPPEPMPVATREPQATQGAGPAGTGWFSGVGMTPVEPGPRQPVRDPFFPGRPNVDPDRRAFDRYGEPMYQNPMDRYMSPYQQGVIDVQKQKALRDADIMRSNIGLQAAGLGSLGGYREGIVESNLNRDLMQQLGDIQQTGQQAGYQNAQRMFEADRAARLAQQQQQLGGAQQLGGLNLNLLQQQLAGAQQLGGLDLSNIQQRLGAAQQLGGLDLNAMQQQLGAAQQLGAFAPTAQKMALERIGALGGVGGQERGFQQAGMDVGYEDFLKQEGYPRQQLGFQSNLIRGLQLPASQTVSQYAQRPGLFQQTLGAGLGALGLYGGMGGGRTP